MKPMKYIFLSLALAMAFSAPAEEAGTGKTGSKAGERDTRRPANEPVMARMEEKKPGELTGQILYQVLFAEMALQRGRADLASQGYYELAIRTNDPGIIARAIEIAGHARRLERVNELARLWVQVEPDSKRAQQVLTSVMAMTNQFDGLAPLLIRLLEADKDALPANLLTLNRLFARSPDKAAVLQLIRTVCTPYAAQPEAHYAIAVAAASANDQEQALTEARKALAMRPNWETAALLEAQLLSQQSPNLGIEALQRFLSRHPQAREAQLYLARLLVGEKRYPEAKHHFEQLLATYPDNPDIVYPVAILALQEKDRPTARTQLKHLLTLNVNDKNAPNFYLGQLAEEDRQIDEALYFYRQVTAGEQFLPAQLRIGKLLADGGQLDLARRQLRGAAEKNPAQRAQFVIGEAALLREAKQLTAAMDVLDQGLAADPDQPDLLYESALLAERLGRQTVSETRLRKLLTLQPENAHAYNALGYSYADRNINLPEARQLIEKALQLAPDDPFILDSLGWVMYRQGDLEGALAKLEQAHAKRPDPEIAAHIGEVQFRLGRHADAQRTFREALKKDPDNEVLNEAARKFAP
ncbi:MAG TPA: tetratricopeptide repeat protein [Accumulibacter sp.]|nr:tetratricopeptide repeat protein [Accumulibacter sp.]HND81005.1 tetratricopeptide repeat protein [Accumulibacter sp.]